MKKHILYLLLLLSVTMLGQSISENKSTTYTSRKGLYKINYDSGKWKQINTQSKCDAEFGDPVNLLSAFFTENDHIISESHLKRETNAQFSRYGKIKKFKTYKKQINNLVVNYLEFELNYNGITCQYQGLVYNGKGGSIELLFAGQMDSIDKNQDSINEFIAGLSLLN